MLRQPGAMVGGGAAAPRSPAPAARQRDARRAGAAGDQGKAGVPWSIERRNSTTFSRLEKSATLCTDLNALAPMLSAEPSITFSSVCAAPLWQHGELAAAERSDGMLK